MLSYFYYIDFKNNKFYVCKSSPNSPRKSVQIVHSYREGNKVRQKIIKHIGVANKWWGVRGVKTICNKDKIRVRAAK